MGADIKKLQKQIADAYSEMTTMRARRRILCSCGKRHPINTLDLLVDHWYIEPYGCTGGDYWKEGEFQFLCPTTKVRNRILFNEWDVEYKKRGKPEQGFKSMYRSLFKSRTDTYDHHYSGCSRPWGGCGCPAGEPSANNYYVDTHREQFELPPKPKKS